ncbi:MAG: TonB family protein [Candidatus Acidiferrales bacterium]
MRGKGALFTAGLAALLTVLPARAQDTGQSIAVPNAAAPSSEAAPKPMRIRVGGNVEQAMLIHQVTPIYPAEAKEAHVQGTVVLHAIIMTDGTIKDLQLVSGPPMLCQAAMDAVRQWTYKPYLLNGNPVEVDTTISVVFTLGGSGESAPGFPATIDPQLKADILQLMEATHAADRAQEGVRLVFDSMRAQLLASIPATPNREKIVSAIEDKLIALVQGQEFMDGIAAVYAKYFSDDDVKALTQFYQTPAGQHLNEHMADVMADSGKVGRQIAAENLSRIFAEVCTEFPELQGQAGFCPASEEKKSQVVPPTAEPGGAGLGAVP